VVDRNPPLYEVSNPMKSYSFSLNLDPLKCLLSKVSVKIKEFRDEHIFPPYDNASVDVNIQKLVLILEGRMNQMSLNVEALAAEVTRVQTVHESAIQFIAKLTDELKAVTEELKVKNEEKIDTSALDDLVAKLDASTDALAAAISTSHDNPVEAPVAEPVVEEVKPE
jgi:hypothetical protein